MTESLDLALIRAAHVRIQPYIKRTPILRSDALDAACGGRLLFKCENFQEAGAFKARGATNAIFLLTEAEAAHGVVAHSSGNHAAAVARAATLRDIPAHIVMPSNAPQVKVRNVESHGGKITFCTPDLRIREETAAYIAAETGATSIHPFDNYRVMAGAGTAALELLEDAAVGLDLILCPVGGGGLLCGTAVAAKGVQPAIKVCGVEPAMADDVAQSVKAGRRISIPTPATIADGLRTNCTGERNFPLIQRHVDEILTVSEAGIAAAMREIWETLKIMIEPSAAVPYAAILEKKIDIRDRTVGIILTGGNVDLDALPWLKK